MPVSELKTIYKQHPVLRSEFLCMMERQIFDRYLHAMVSQDYLSAHAHADALTVVNDALCEGRSSFHGSRITNHEARS